MGSRGARPRCWASWRAAPRPLLPLLLSLLSLLSLPPRAAAFHDDDCELAAGATDAAVPWAAFREQLARPELAAGPEAQALARRALERWEQARAQCPLGLVAACLLGADAARAEECVEGVEVPQALGSRWPIFRLLNEVQERTGLRQFSCDDKGHPSLDWPDWRQKVDAFVVTVPLWLDGRLESENIPDDYNEAMSDAQGVVWKASSGAVADGHSIAEWTALCSFGVMSAHLVRAGGLILSGGDVYRIVERGLETGQSALDHVGEVMKTNWRIFGILHALSLMKNALHDTRFAPRDFLPLAAAAEGDRSQVWAEAAAGLRRAAAFGANLGIPDTVILTSLPHTRVNFLLNLFKHLDRLGTLAPVAVVPTRENLTEACLSIAELFQAQRAAPAQESDDLIGWQPCLPFLSMFPARSQWAYLHTAVNLGLSVLWFDFHVVWLQSPLPFVKRALAGVDTALPYQQTCALDCAGDQQKAPPELFVAEDFYQRYWPRNTLLLLRPTAAVRVWVETFTRWLFTYPYANVARGLHYMAYPDQLDAVPSMSRLPNGEAMPSVSLGYFDVEQQFVGFDGWFGEFEQVVSFEIAGFIQESDRMMLLDRMLNGQAEDWRLFVSQSRKLLSPLRPSQRLYQRHNAGLGAPERCQWEEVQNAYIGGFAAGDERAFGEPAEAQCLCRSLGAECAGVTCEPLEGGGQGCTVRRGEPALAASPAGEVSYVKRCGTGDCDAPPIERIVHVNFADGCCEFEQNQSSTTAKQFGADESRPLRGDFLDEDFKARNHVLLTFNRTPELTQHKTPSGKVGYYVWKPYVVWKTLADPSLPFDTTVVAWTDAGIYFVDDMRPLIRKYLRTSDVAATRTPMLEGDFSKRDAFLLLDADYQTIMETNQIATGIILARKTPLALEFMEKWLRACEERRIMTEEPSVLGLPDYPTYKNNNDDQTAFSLLFKRYGFEPFSVGERDAVVYTGRNLAKFIKASDDFAVGKKTDREEYLKAADDAAKRRKATGGER